MDIAWLSLMHQWQHPLLTTGMVAVTWLGSLFVLLPAALFAAWRQSGNWRQRAFLPASLIGATAVVHLLKWLIDRGRPDSFPSLVAMPADASFPSAHAMQIAALVTASLIWQKRWQNGGNLAIGILLVTAVGLSRTYLQVHFLSDVLFGIAAGVVWAMLLHQLPVWQKRQLMRHKFLGIGEPGYHPLRKIATVASGLRYAVIYDWSVKYKLILSTVVLAGAFAMRAWVDFLLIVVVTAFVVFAEIVNSAIEALCDFVEERHNEKIKIIKDIAAAGVGIAIFAWLVVIAVEVSRYLEAKMIF